MYEFLLSDRFIKYDERRDVLCAVSICNLFNQLTRKLPPAPSSISNTYASTRLSEYGDQTRVTALFSALHLSGRKAGGPGATGANTIKLSRGLASG